MPTAVVVGGSLSGLMSALTLSRAGVDVTVLERASAAPRSGAAVGVDDAELARITGVVRQVTTSSSLPADVQAWASVHARLRAAVETDSHIEVRNATTALCVGQDADAAWVVTSTANVRGDVVIGADGHRSIVRGYVSPERPDATFAGYQIWLGIADEAALGTREQWPREVAFLRGGDDLLLGYPLPGRDGSTVPGKRQIGWAWYDASRNALLRETGCVRDQVVHHSLAGEDIPTDILRELASQSDRWSSPWRDAIRDCIARRGLLGIPIAEYVPTKLVNGRVALVGDAAHVPTPMTASGFSASLYDAEAIAEAVADGLRRGDMAHALAAYQRRRLNAVRQIVLSGQEFSRSFASRAA